MDEKEQLLEKNRRLRREINQGHIALAQIVITLIKQEKLSEAIQSMEVLRDGLVLLETDPSHARYADR